jgi:diguanylate cyclase (GGDEF)-like protein
MIRHVRRSLGRKLLIAVGLPALALALALVLWLQHKAAGTAPCPDPAFRAALAVLVIFAVAVGATHVLAMRWLLEQPLQRLAAALRRAREGDFLHRVPVEGEDEIGMLAQDFNSTLAAITDLHARRIDDQASMASMQRELALKQELELRVRELTLLFDLSRRLVSTLELDRLIRIVTELVGRGLGDHGFALLLAEDGTGDLVVRGVYGLDEGVNGTRIPAGEGPAGWAARERSTLLVRDTREDARKPVLPWQHGAAGSILAIPLVHQDACGGVLAFFRTALDAFPADEVRLLESVAGQAAIAFENARLHQQMVRLSLTDALTGVQNRRSLFARLEMDRERCERFDQPMAIALVDVDHFRLFNERFGHVAGDGLLKRVAEVLSRSVRKVDLVARYGGEEFAILLPRADRSAALAAGEGLRAAVAAAAIPCDVGGPGHVTISVGVASFPVDAVEVAALIDCADAALFAAKRAGRDTVRAHEPGMRAHPGRKRDVRTTADADAGT